MFHNGDTVKKLVGYRGQFCYSAMSMSAMCQSAMSKSEAVLWSI